MSRRKRFEEWSGPARKRLYRALPLIGSALALFGIMSDAKAAVVVGIVGILIGPATGEVAARHVPDDETLGTSPGRGSGGSRGETRVGHVPGGNGRPAVHLERTSNVSGPVRTRSRVTASTSNV
jgi:hypothetical protein